MSRDLYRRERRRLRAEELLIERGVDRTTQRRLWRLTRIMAGGFTSLSRVIDLHEDLDLVARAGMLRHRVFPGWQKTPEVIAWGRAVIRQARKRRERRLHRERMAQHRAEHKRLRRPVAVGHDGGCMKLRLAEDLALPVEFATQTALVVGKRG